MSWKTRKKGTVRQKGKKFKTKDIYVTKVGNRKFHLSLTDNPGPLRMSCAQLEVAFEHAKHNPEKQKKILKLAISMANKAKARGLKKAEKEYRETYKRLKKESIKETFVVRNGIKFVIEKRGKKYFIVAYPNKPKIGKGEGTVWITTDSKKTFMKGTDIPTFNTKEEAIKYLKTNKKRLKPFGMELKSRTGKTQRAVPKTKTWFDKGSAYSLEEALEKFKQKHPNSKVVDYGKSKGRYWIEYTSRR